MNAEADIEISVSTFNDIIIVKNSLVICDIDETLLYYEGIDKTWWSETFYRYYQIHKDYDKADQLCLAEWTSHITSADKYPFFTDIAGYANMIAKINETNSQIVFLTARCEYLRDNPLYLSWVLKISFISKLAIEFIYMRSNILLFLQLN